jgi:hypothetical protein
MNQINKQTEVGREMAAGVVEDARPVASPARRRLIKLGTAAVPVVATLTSRPAFAWHCMSPAAWGSIDANPNTSLKTNAGHQTYADETWYISNWKDNIARSATGTSSPPWDVFFIKYPSIKSAASNKSSKVTIAMLQGIGIQGAGADPNAKVRALLGTGTEFQKSVITAQLNYLTLSPLISNKMESCLAFDKLTEMASGTYYPVGSGSPAWYADEIVRYLKENWIAL